MKKHYSKLLRICLLGAVFAFMGFLSPGSNALQAATVVKNLRVEYMKNPVGIDVATPRFSWILESDTKGQLQTAYEIVVSTNEDGTNVVWNSGKVVSDQSMNVKYSGATALAPSTRYYWSAKVWDKDGVETSPAQKAYFETGLMGSGWSGAKWLKMGTAENVEGDYSNVTDYSISFDFEVSAISMAFNFASSADHRNYFMWQINLEQADNPRFRPHVWTNGNPALVHGKQISIKDKVDVKIGETHTMRIDIVGDMAKTYIDNILIDESQNPRGGNYGFGEFGFRQDHDESGAFEKAYFDNLVVTAKIDEVNTTIYQQDFSDPNNPGFLGGTVVGGRFLVVGGAITNNAWQKPKDANYTDVREYSISCDFEIDAISMGFSFAAAKDRRSYFMWQINLQQAGNPRFRPHVWTNGNPALVHGKEISLIPLGVNVQLGETHTMRIDIVGDMAKTYIDNILIDESQNPRGGDYGFGDFGFREDHDEAMNIEKAYFDNLKVTGKVGGADATIYQQNFSDPDNPGFYGGVVENGRFLVVGGANTNNAWQKSVGGVNMTIETDITILTDGAGLIFGAQDLANFHMWGFNVHDNTYPILRRHVNENGNWVVVNDIRLDEKGFAKTDLINKEVHIKIDVRDNLIKTYINNILVDEFLSANIKKGYTGFRAYDGNNTYEHAYYDNLKVTNYEPDGTGGLQAAVALSENFEGNSHPFGTSWTIDINGNKKLDLKPLSQDYRVLQDGANGIPMFRTEIDLTKTVKSAKIYTSALGLYDLFINSKRVGTLMPDGTTVYDELKPGWTDYRKTVFYSTYDVTNLLTQGKNAIGAIVSSGYLTGGVSHGKYGTPDLGFIAKLLVTYTDGTEDIFTTNTSTWVTSKNSATRVGDIYNGEEYNAQLESNWTSADFGAHSWNPAAINTYFTGTIKAFQGVPVQVRPQLEQVAKKLTIYKGIKDNGSTFGEINVVNTIENPAVVNLEKGQSAIYDFGQNMVGWVKYKVKGAAGTKIRLRFAEMLNDSGDTGRGNDNAKGTLYLKNLRTAQATQVYTLKGDPNGETFNPSMTFYGFRYCEILTMDDIEIQSIVGEVIGSATEESSALTTSNKDVNQLYSNILWGQRGNYVGIPTDCPQRDERLGWTGDTQVFSRAATYNADVESFLRKWLGDVRDSQAPNGAYTNIAPHSWTNEDPQGAWSEAGIIVPWNLYLMYGDKDLIEEHYASMEKYMNYLSTQKFDGYLYNGAGTEHGDWLSYEDTDKRYISVSHYAYAADLMAKMSKVIGKTEDATKYETLFNNIKAEYQGRYLNTDGTLKSPSQTGYLLALKFNLLKNDEQIAKAKDALVKRIADKGDMLQTGFVGTGTINQTLSEFGASETAYNLLLQRNNPSWLYSVDQGATTIWERWNSYTIERGFGDPVMNSFNHYAYGAVGEWMYRYMAGIDTDQNKVAFKHIVLRPTPDTRTTLPQGQERITKVDASYASYYGNVKSKWEQDEEGKITYTVTVPANTTATLYLPKLKVTDHASVLGVETPIAELEGVVSFNEEDSRFVLELKSGSYAFVVEKGSDVVVVPAFSLTINDEEFENFDQPYIVKKDYTANTLTVKITASTGAVVEPANEITVDVSKPTVKDVPFSITYPNGDVESHTLTVNKYFNFDELVKTRWNNTLAAINNPANNKGFTFTAYEWYCNGTKVGTKQYYSAGKNGEKLNPNDQYYLVVTDKTTTKNLRTWEANPTLKSLNVKVYPNPATVGEAIYVDADLEDESLEDATINVYNSQGINIKNYKVKGKLTPITINGSGTYIFLLKGKDNLNNSMKVIVK